MNAPRKVRKSIRSSCRCSASWRDRQRGAMGSSSSVPVRQVAALLPRFLQTAPRGHRPCASLARRLHQTWAEDLHLRAVKHARHTRSGGRTNRVHRSLENLKNGFPQLPQALLVTLIRWHLSDLDQVALRRLIIRNRPLDRSKVRPAGQTTLSQRAGDLVRQKPADSPPPLGHVNPRRCARGPPRSSRAPATHGARRSGHPPCANNL